MLGIDKAKPILRASIDGLNQASSPKAMSLIASGEYRRRWWGDGYRRRKRRDCWRSWNKGSPHITARGACRLIRSSSSSRGYLFSD
jgi:hypothetical protein